MKNQSYNLILSAPCKLNAVLAFVTPPTSTVGVGRPRDCSRRSRDLVCRHYYFPCSYAKKQRRLLHLTLEKDSSFRALFFWLRRFFGETATPRKPDC
eukprot:scaffold2987_cov170-Amphora_coffeaeformis.AAC.2